MRRLVLLFAATALTFLGTRAYVTHARTSTLASILVVQAPLTWKEPTSPVTRAEGLVMTLRSRELFAPQILWFTEHLPEIALFPDINQESGEAPYIEVAFLEGIMRGGSDGKFHPEAPLTIEQALVLISRTYQWTGGVPFQSSPALTNKESTWYTEAVSEAIDRNLLPENSLLSLGTPVRYGDFEEILRRLRVAEEENTYAYKREKTQPVTQNEPSATAPLRVTPVQSITIPLPEVAPPTSPSLAFASTKYFAITIPELDFTDLEVRHPTDPFTETGILDPLQYGAGHLFSYPGTGGKAMIYMHSSDWPWKKQNFARIGARLDKLQTGDRAYVTYAGKLHVYEVTGSAIISPDDNSPFEDDGTEELILYTCWPPNSVAKRWITFMQPIETVALREG